MSGIATGKSESRLAFTLERLIFGHRVLIIVLFALVTMTQKFGTSITISMEPVTTSPVGRRMIRSGGSGRSGFANRSGYQHLSVTSSGSRMSRLGSSRPCS